MTLAATHHPFRLTGWHVLAGFVVFFGITIAVDSYMMVSAYKTFPGQVESQPYEDGLAYDSTLDQQKAQAALGWRMSIGLYPGGVIRLTAADRNGAAVQLPRIAARIERPATEQGRRDIRFLAVSPGVYEAHIGAVSGVWDVKLSAYDAANRRFDAERRVTAR
jgi:nitrogen fixation protein FixH